MMSELSWGGINQFFKKTRVQFCDIDLTLSKSIHMINDRDSYKTSIILNQS